MAEIRLAAAADYPALAAFQHAVNEAPEARCLHTHGPDGPGPLLADIEAAAERGQFLAVVESDGLSLTGWIGCEFDAAKGRAWLWGPALQGDAGWTERMGALLDGLLAALPREVVRLSAFPDQRNIRTAAALGARGAQAGKPVHIYTAARPAVLPAAPAAVRALQPGDRPALAALHAASFPNTYLSAEEMFAVDGVSKRLFVAESEGPAGYLLASVQADGSGYVDFVAVDERRRRRGLAGALLTAALAWLFGERDVPEVSLTVNDDRSGARALYGRAGFDLILTGQPLDLTRGATAA
ncbi:MAG TPA: GNAT family N-acetyltransferase [Alphaproteobacteria bacterium]|nr:GNAT family N-acetyltransferase [Alphaproteobacteria bacterium]